MPMMQSKVDLLKKFADNQEEDEIFGDVESVDFSGPKQQKQQQQQQHRDHNNEDDNVIDTLKMKQLHINNSPSFQLTPKNALTSSSSPPQHTRSSKSSTGGRSNHISRASNGSSNSAKRITRDALSEYSEENDTDITSELSQDEFEGWDECFSKNQSIYQQMNQRLIAKKVAQQKEAEREQRELLEYKHSKGMKDDPNQTLKFRNGVAIDGGGAGAGAGHKLTSTNLSMLDHLENDKTINYEFSRDDNDEFEDGFDGDFEESIQKIKQYQQQHQSRRNMGSAAKHGLLNKQSMPSLAKNSTNAIKKFKSTMDLTGDTLHEHPNEQQQQQRQPPATFNFNNRVISKLDRIPSFYNKPRISDPESRMQLLDKYAERKDQKAKDKNNASIKAGVDARGVAKDTRTSDAQNYHHRHHHPHKKMGHVRYLNNKEGIGANGEPLSTDYVIPKSKSMVFNKAQNRWEGNEVDLLRFEQKPSLITLKEIKPVGKEIVDRDALDALDDDDDFPGMKRQGNMLYDDVNLKWINLDQDDEYIFDDIPDLIEPLETIRQHHNLQQKQHQQQQEQQQQQQQEQGQWEQYSPTRPKLDGTNTIYVLQSPISRRGLSQFTQRTTSSTSSNMPPPQPQPQPLSTASRSNLIRSQSSSSRVDPTTHQWHSQSQSQSQSQQNLQRHVSMSNNNTSIPPVSQKLHDKFVKEEAKIGRKINHWFIDDNNDVKLDYYWEIRKLIMED